MLIIEEFGLKDFAFPNVNFLNHRGKTMRNPRGFGNNEESWRIDDISYGLVLSFLEEENRK